MRGSRLNGRTIMLATGMPSEEGGYAMPRFGGWDIDQAIIALARATSPKKAGWSSRTAIRRLPCSSP